MNANSAGRRGPSAVSTTSAPNRKNVASWNTALTFSLNCPKTSGRSCSNAEHDAGHERCDQPVADRASASPYANSASPRA